eukprot:643860-Hanusia_phi.AAC.6
MKYENVGRKHGEWEGMAGSEERRASEGERERLWKEQESSGYPVKLKKTLTHPASMSPSRRIRFVRE